MIGTEGELTSSEIHRDELSLSLKEYEISVKRMEIPPVATHDRPVPILGEIHSRYSLLNEFRYKSHKKLEDLVQGKDGALERYRINRIWLMGVLH